jgi:hypothetical protein
MRLTDGVNLKQLSDIHLLSLLGKLARFIAMQQILLMLLKWGSLQKSVRKLNIFFQARQRKKVFRISKTV